MPSVSSKLRVASSTKLHTQFHLLDASLQFRELMETSSASPLDMLGRKSPTPPSFSTFSASRP